MKNKFTQHILKEKFFETNKTVLLAISGGVDSVVLFHLLLDAKINFVCAHVNYQLRGHAADEDELFVRNICENNGIEIHVLKKDTKAYSKKHKLGIQEAARKIRYQWFDQLTQKHHYNKIITAHHADDKVETFFINLIRGTGLKGLTGIEGNKGNLIRPLLFAAKTDIIDFAKKENIKFRQDESNFENKYLRNKLRNEIIPSIHNISKDFNQMMYQNIDRLKMANNFIEEKIDAIKEVFVTHKNDHTFILKSVLNEKNKSFILYELLNKYGFNSTQVKIVLSDPQVGKTLFSISHELVIEREYFLIQPLIEFNSNIHQYTIHKDGITDHLPFSLKVDQIEAKHYRLSNDPSVALLDIDKLDFPLTIRKWKDGDKFNPLGMYGSKLISDFLTQEKVDANSKRDQYVVISNEKIIWIIGMRIGDGVKLTPKTTQILRMQLLSR